MRTYLNLEVEQLVTLLTVFAELELSRDLTRSEKYVRELVKEGLDRAPKQFQKWLIEVLQHSNK